MLAQSKSKHLFHFNNLLLEFLFIFQDRINDTSIYYEIFEWCSDVDSFDVVVDDLNGFSTKNGPDKISSANWTYALVNLCKPCVVLLELRKEIVWRENFPSFAKS